MGSFVASGRAGSAGPPGRIPGYPSRALVSWFAGPPVVNPLDAPRFHTLLRLRPPSIDDLGPKITFLPENACRYGQLACLQCFRITPTIVDNLMSERPLSAFALHLATYATRTGGPLPLLDGLSASLGAQGMAFLARPLQKAPEALWFRQTPTFKVLSDSLTSPAGQRDFVLVVQWRRLLSKALLRHDSTADVSPALRQLAHHAWWTLLPLLEDHDPVLAQLITAAQKNYQGSERQNFEPLWVGFDTEDDERRFDAQALSLLASRRTDKSPHDGFCEAAATWFRTAFTAATNLVVQRTVGHCTVGKHTRGGICPTCPEIAKERPFLLALDVPVLLDRHGRRNLDAPSPTQPKSPPSIVRDNLLWILSTRSRRDGVCSFDHNNGAKARFIDFQRLWARWRELELPTMFDNITTMEKIDGPRQARAFFAKLLKGRVIPEHSYSAESLFIEADWGTAEDFATSYSQFEAVYEGALLQALAEVDQRTGALLKARSMLPKTKQSRPARRVVTLRWAPYNGDLPVPINVIRSTSQGKRVLNFYTLPYEVEDEMVKDRWARIGKGILYDQQIYWSAQTINYFANKRTPDDEPEYPWAREFCEWVGAQEPLLCDDKLFNAALYSDRLPKRLEAIARGDMAHLGMFSLKEDEIITEFFVTKQAQKRLAPQDWLPLLDRLPGRQERGILKRFEDLGKKYALAHGYQAYMRSPWHRKFSAQRRKQWVKEGCPAC